MSTFQGFKVTAIDSNKYPVLSDDRILYDEFYLILRPIGGNTDIESENLWDDSFRWVLKNWENYEELNCYKQFELEIPHLYFISQSNDRAFICAPDIPLQSLVSCIPFIKTLVDKANARCLKLIDAIRRDRADIDNINASHFDK